MKPAIIRISSLIAALCVLCVFCAACAAEKPDPVTYQTFNESINNAASVTADPPATTDEQTAETPSKKTSTPDNSVADSSIEISPPDKSIVELVSKKYDETELLEISEFDGSLNGLSIKYPIECLRRDNGMYRASYLGNGSVAILVYDSSGNKILGNIYSMQLLKTDFNGLKKGQSLDEVIAIDPDGVYLFLYTGRNDIPRKSSHYTKDGYLITVEYDVSNVIISINEELI